MNSFLSHHRHVSENDSKDVLMKKRKIDNHFYVYIMLQLRDFSHGFFFFFFLSMLSPYKY